MKVSWRSALSVPPYFSIRVVLMAGLMLTSPLHAEAQAETAQQQVSEAIAFGNVQSVIASLPILEEMWPDSMEDYFQSAEQITRFLDNTKDNPNVQKAMQSLYAEVFNKHCPDEADLVQAAAFFDHKSKLVRCLSSFDSMRYNKPHLLAVSRFLGEIRDRRIPDYIIRDSRIPGLSILRKAGVKEASSLTNPIYIKAYEDTVNNPDRAMKMNRLQRTLLDADSSMTGSLLYSCRQLKRKGQLDEKFVNEVAENAQLTEKEREMRFSFDDEAWGK